MPNKTKLLWDIRQSVNSETLDIRLYGDVEGNGYDWWSGKEIKSNTSALTFAEKLEEYPNAKTINIYINSNGGDVYEGAAIYGQLMRHSAYKNVYVDGFAASIASVIAMAGNKVYMAPNAMMVIHNAWSFAVGNANDLRQEAEALDKVTEASRQAYLLKIGDKLTNDKLIEMMDNETWLTAEECIQYGFADELTVDKKVSDGDMVKTLQQMNNNLATMLQHRKQVLQQMRELGKMDDFGRIDQPETPLVNHIPEPPEEPKQNKEMSLANLLTGLF